MKKKSEGEIQLEICNWLSNQNLVFWRFRYMSRFPIKFLPRGLPDIMILYKGIFIGLEVKVPDYWKHTDKQILMGQEINKNGGYYYVTTSLGEAMEVLAIHAPDLTVV